MATNAPSHLYWDSKLIILRVSTTSKDEWNAFDVTLSNATCISQAHLSIVFFADTLTYEKIF